MQVKIFSYNWDADNLEEIMNNWIIQNQAIIEIKDIRIKCSEKAYMGYIIYENKPVLKEDKQSYYVPDSLKNVFPTYFNQ